MTRVTLKRDGDKYFVYAKGHATGSVETCAAISTLVYTLAGYLNNSDIEILEDHISDANVKIAFRGDENAEVAFDMMCVGFLELQQAHPQFVEVIYN